MPTLRPRLARPLSLALLLALAVLLAPLAVARPVGAATCMVTTGANSGAGSLRAALANSDDFVDCATITFAPAVTEVSVTVRLEIARDVTIQGPGAGALALKYVGPVASTGSVLFVRKGTVAISGLTISGGRTQGIWGAGLATYGDLGATAITLDGVVITDNIAANAGGGGIYASNATLALVHSTVSNNQSTGAANSGYGGGGIFLDSYYGNIAATLTNTTVSGNQALNNDGGGIRVWYRASGTTATLTLEGSMVSGNAANSGGGFTANGTATVTNSTISGNTATGSGGAALFDFGHVALTNSTVSGNSAMGSGGGFYISAGSEVQLTFATITGNIADSDAIGGGDGGGLNTGGSMSLTYVRSSIVAGNIDRTDTQSADCFYNNHVSQGYNLYGNANPCPATGTDRNLATLGVGIAAVLNPSRTNNGGPTETHALVLGGPAIDAIPAAECAPVTSDQRGLPRPQTVGGLCDIGAYEYQPPAPSPSPSPSPSSSPSAAPCGQRFGDVPAADPACVAIEALAARGIINGCDSTAVPPLFCPTDTTLRHQMAALIVRAMPGWAAETWPNTFTDPTEDTELWRRVGTLQHYGVVGGYTAESCQAQGKTTPCYGPLDPVLKAQAISFVTRAMVAKHYWTQQAIDPNLYGGALVGTGHETDASTYWYYTRSKGGVPDLPEAGGFPLGEAAPRAWFARLLWTAIQGTPAAP